MRKARVLPSFREELGDGEGMQVPCTLQFKGTAKFINVLRQELRICNSTKKL